MYFKEWLLQERRYTNLVNDIGENYTVYLNPTIDEVQQLVPHGTDREARAFIAGDDHIYMWDERYASHEETAMALNERIKLPFYINSKAGYYIARPSSWSSGIAQDRMNALLQAHPQIKKMLGWPESTNP